MTLETLEDILLADDQRGMTALRPYLAADYCQQAARLLHGNSRRVLICTGFYVQRLRAPETDGPPGALAIGRAVEHLGGKATYLSDRYSTPLLRQHTHSEVIEFPICGWEESRRVARYMLEQVQPTLLVSIERCGATARGQYRNSRGEDISAHTAKLDSLFEHGIFAIGVGDGGNEIGMGNLAGVIPSIPGLPCQPAVTTVDALVIASVSNWGGYGLTAALSALAGADLLPDPDEEAALICQLYAAGCYDGTGQQPECGVDGFPPEKSGAVIRRLRQWLHETRQ